MRFHIDTALILLFAASSALIAEDPLAANPNKPKLEVDEHGFHVHRADSEYQQGAPAIRVLTPSAADADKSYRCLYVLPVEAGLGEHWG
ncbi:MAG: hypothetical protein N2C14_26675, partial [Planctomycetales bacterium]